MQTDLVINLIGFNEAHIMGASANTFRRILVERLSVSANMDSFIEAFNAGINSCFVTELLQQELQQLRIANTRMRTALQRTLIEF